MLAGIAGDLVKGPRDAVGERAGTSGSYKRLLESLLEE
jgi:hypothetical protein